MTNPNEESEDERIDSSSTRRALPILVVAAGGLAVGLLLLAVLGLDESIALARAAWDFLLAAPAPVYFGILTMALLLPVPVSALYVTAGPIYGVATSLLWIAPCLAVNAVLVHALGTSGLRPVLWDMLTRREIPVRLPESQTDQLLFATLVRVTPGIPYFLQSWVIVLAGVDRWPFVLLSVGIQMIYATGFVVLGRSAFEGNLGLAALALAFLVAAGMAARLFHNHLVSRSGNAE